MGRALRRRGEGGHLLIAVMVGVAIMLVFSAVALQSWSMTIRRENEEELIFRGKQYAMAIKLFQKYNGRYPSELKELSERTGPAGGALVLRRKFRDPMTKDGEWGLVYLAPQGGAVSSAQLTEASQSTGAIGEEEWGQPVTVAAGLPVIGVHSRSEEAPIGPKRWGTGITQKYSEWLFTINDIGAQSAAGVVGPGTGAGGPQQPGGTQQPGATQLKGGRSGTGFMQSIGDD